MAEKSRQLAALRCPQETALEVHVFHGASKRQLIYHSERILSTSRGTFGNRRFFKKPFGKSDDPDVENLGRRLCYIKGIKRVVWYPFWIEVTMRRGYEQEHVQLLVGTTIENFMIKSLNVKVTYATIGTY